LNDTLVMLKSRLRSGIKVNRAFAEEVPRIQGYGSELNQVWTHLIDNAIAAMGDEGTLVLDVHQESDWVVVEVADSGPGIPPEVQGKIFDPFYTTKAPGEGTGLGLSLCHGIVVEKHRGQITVDSQPGETRFIVKLPITDDG
jgi:signal transduction histidine kinase